jgi:hypothetical protein
LEFGKQNPSVKAYVVRPGGVLAKGGGALLRHLLPTFAVRVDELAAAMVDITVHGGGEQVVDNKDIVQRGREFLMKQK